MHLCKSNSALWNNHAKQEGPSLGNQKPSFWKSKEGMQRPSCSSAQNCVTTRQTCSQHVTYPDLVPAFSDAQEVVVIYAFPHFETLVQQVKP